MSLYRTITGGPDLSPFRFVSGAAYPIRGALYALFHPSLWLYCLAPLLINIAVAWGVWHWSEAWVSRLLHAYGNSTGWWAHTVHFLSASLAWILRVLVTLVAIIVFGNFVALPFNDYLSARVDWLAAGYRDPHPFSITRVALILAEEIKRMAIYIFILLALLAASFSGVLAPFAVPAKFVLTTCYLALDYLSYPLERRGAVLLRQKANFVRANLAPCLGFGSLILLTALIPGLNLFFLPILIPISVVGGTLLHADIERRRNSGAVFSAG